DLVDAARVKLSAAGRKLLTSAGREHEQCGGGPGPFDDRGQGRRRRHANRHSHSSLFTRAHPSAGVHSDQLVRRTPDVAIPRTAFRLERLMPAINGMAATIWYKPGQRRRG